MKHRLHRLVLTTLAAAALPLAALVATRVLGQVPVDRMTRDVAAIAGLHPLAGFLSTLGILLWWGSAAIQGHTASVLRAAGHEGDAGFFAYSSALSAYLALDDQFQIHEHLAPQYLGLPERAVYGLLALAVLVYLARYRHQFRSVDGRLLALALAGLSASVIVDVGLDRWLWQLQDWVFLVEDGLKWLGVCFWAAYAVVRCHDALRAPLIAPPPVPYG